jgi:TRAP-type C4-dicarboxylate transport system permease small subunit
MTRPFTMIAALIFAIMALLHVYRLFTHFQVVLGSHEIPMWMSYVAIVVAGGLAIGLFRESR